MQHSVHSKSYLFSEYALPYLRDDPGYATTPSELNVALKLADRAAHLFRLTGAFAGSEQIIETIGQLEDRVGRDDENTVRQLLQQLEIWLKGLLQLLRPELFIEQNQQDSRSFTLNRCIRELGLLEGYELERPDDVRGPVRRRIAASVLLRNQATHQPGGRPREIDERLESALLTMITPVIRHREALRERFRGLILRPINDELVRLVLQRLERERRRHLDGFRGREQVLSAMDQDIAIADNGQYYLVVGPEEVGKSALLSAFSARLSLPLEDLRSDEAVEWLRIAPWLPGILLVSGEIVSGSGDLDMQVRALIEQINTMLIRPQPLPDPKDDVDNYLKELSSQRSRSSSGSFRDDSSELATVRQAGLNRPAVAPRPSTTVISGALRQALQTALELLADEYGPVVLVVDAIDRLVNYGFDLSLFPRTLPRGIKVICSARSGHQVVDQLRREYKAQIRQLKGLELEEIALLTNVDGAAGEDEAAFNVRVYRTSGGLPPLVRQAGQLALVQPHALEKITLASNLQTLFKATVDQWLEMPSNLSTRLRFDLLGILAVFEPVEALSLDLLQGFFVYNEVSIRGFELVDMLTPLAGWVDLLDNGTVRLSNSGLANYVYAACYTGRERAQLFVDICTWLLSEEEYASSRFLARFIYFWAHSQQKVDERVKKSVLHLVSQLCDADDALKLFDLYRESLHASGNLILPPSYALSFLHRAAELKHPPALLELSERLLDGRGITQDLDEGRRLIEEAVKANDERAKLSLGLRLIKGTGLERDVERGEALLAAAAVADDRAALILAMHYLVDVDDKSLNPSRGQELLRELHERGNREASYILATMLIAGSPLPFNKDEGLSLLQHLTDQGDNRAALELAKHYINSDEPLKNEGERLLDELIGRGNIDAIIFYSDLLLRGKPDEAAKVEARRLLERAISFGSQEAAMLLGMRLLNGYGLQKDKVRGEMLLRKTAKERYFPAMYALGRALLGGVLNQHVPDARRLLEEVGHMGMAPALLDLALFYVEQPGKFYQPALARTYFEQAITMGYAPAMTCLALLLFDAKHYPRDPEKAVSLLQAASNRGHAQAVIMLSFAYMGGLLGLPKSQEMGMEMLHRAAEQGDPEVIEELGSVLLKSKDAAERSKGLRLIRDACEKDSESAMVEFGYQLLFNPDLHSDRTEALNWLERAAASSITAKVKLAKLLLFNYVVPADYERGERLLRQAADAGNIKAIATLGMMLIRGRPLRQNLHEGQKLIEQARNRANMQLNDAIGINLYVTGDISGAAKLALGDFSKWYGGPGELIFLMRRHPELKLIGAPSFDSLVSEDLILKGDKNQVGYALCLAQGFQVTAEPDWRRADEIMANLSGGFEVRHEVMRLWYCYLVQMLDDPEGHLVTGWLVRHSFIDDPDGWEIAQRMQRARQGGWNVPEWLEQPVLKPSGGEED